MTKVELPKWFQGEVYDEGAEVTNRFGGDSCYLTAEELSMYDFIKGAEFVMSGMSSNTKLISEMRRGLDWFRSANASAYMVLLD